MFSHTICASHTSDVNKPYAALATPAKQSALLFEVFELTISVAHITEYWWQVNEILV
jgi:hypothetical protein